MMQSSPPSNRLVISEGQTQDALEGGLLKVADAARLLGLGRSKLYDLMERGEIQYVKFGRSRRIPRTELAKLVERNLIGGREMDS